MFDPSAPHIIILLIVVLLLFGAKRLPGAAQSLGESMHIFKKSVHGPDANGKPMDNPVAAATQQQQQQQQKVAELQRQIQELQGQNVATDGTTVNGVPLSEVQPNQQPF